jgi:hypothetical protein
LGEVAVQEKNLKKSEVRKVGPRRCLAERDMVRTKRGAAWAKKLGGWTNQWPKMASDVMW